MKFDRGGLAVAAVLRSDERRPAAAPDRPGKESPAVPRRTPATRPVTGPATGLALALLAALPTAAAAVDQSATATAAPAPAATAPSATAPTATAPALGWATAGPASGDSSRKACRRMSGRLRSGP